jgi:chromosome partitioning protein
MPPFIVASLIEKGGAGKTTTAIHVAEALGREGRLVLLVELDPQKNASRWIGTSEAKRSMFEVMQEPDAPLDDAISSTVVPNVDIISGARQLGMPERILSVDSTGNPRNMYEVLKRALENVPPRYDVVIIDCPPSVGALNTNAIVAADLLLISMDPSQLTYDGFAALALTLQQMSKNRLLSRLPQISVVFTAWNPKWRIAKEVKSLVEKFAGDRYHVFEGFVRNRVIMRNLPNTKQTAFMVDDDSAREVAADYVRVAAELLALMRFRLEPVLSA